MKEKKTYFNDNQIAWIKENYQKILLFLQNWNLNDRCSQNKLTFFNKNVRPLWNGRIRGQNSVFFRIDKICGKSRKTNK